MFTSKALHRLLDVAHLLTADCLPARLRVIRILTETGGLREDY